MRRGLALMAAVVLGLALTGCSDQLGDRGGDEGSKPDKISDVDYIEVYRNADKFPNVALICIEGIAFASTSSGGPSLVRMPEWDKKCPGATPATPSPSPS
ncbi:hypothetical protein [Actinoplanes sp. NPDC051494]|uniref:hypothetical protein n=1 Tax=Actinoplanes sp. NPDC051494 TaxID=3363907 RepID=UPI00379C49EC